MFDKLTSGMKFSADALLLRSERQRILASNIANVDTPGYVARDFDFKQALADASGGEGSLGKVSADMRMTHGKHLNTLPSGTSLVDRNRLGYSVASQPSADGNSVDLDRERAAFADNALRYEATLRFINGDVKDVLSAIQGQ